MDDLMGVYQKAYDSESRRMADQEQASTERIRRQKLMLDLIRSETPIRREDVRDLANMGSLDARGRSRLLGSLFEQDPDLATRAISEFNTQSRLEQSNEYRIGMENLRDIVDIERASQKRQAAIPSPEEYGQLWPAMFPGEEMPTYNPNWTRADIQAIGRSRQLTKSSQQARTKSAATQAPADESYIQAMIDLTQKERPQGIETWPKSEVQRYFSAQAPKPKTEPQLTPGQAVTSIDDLANHLRSVWRMKVSDASNSLVDAVAERAIQEGGDVYANSERIRTGLGIPPKGMNDKQANAFLDKLYTMPRKQAGLSEEEKVRRLRALLGPARGRP